MTKEEKNALEKVESSLTHNGSRYSVAVPWKEDCLILPINREMAIKRLEGTEVDSRRNVVSVVLVPATFSDSQVKQNNNQSAHSVRFLGKVRTRVDERCHLCRSKLSYKPMFDVLVRFRRNPIVIACDTKEMDLQIEMEEKDRPYFRILW